MKNTDLSYEWTEARQQVESMRTVAVSNMGTCVLYLLHSSQPCFQPQDTNVNGDMHCCYGFYDCVVI